MGIKCTSWSHMWRVSQPSAAAQLQAVWSLSRTFVTLASTRLNTRRFQVICSSRGRGGCSWDGHVWPARRPFCKDQVLCKHDLIVEASSLPGSSRECWEGTSNGSIWFPDQKMISGPLSQPEENLLGYFSTSFTEREPPSSTGLDTPESLFLLSAESHAPSFS